MNSNQNYLIILLSILAMQALLIFWVGNVYINTHELDVLHALDGALRLADGERPHLDFMTPLGVLTFAPPALMLKLGLGRGAAMAFSGVLVAALFLPALYWVGSSRLSGLLRNMWGGLLIILITASIFGDTSGNNSFSMYYNRWCWAAAFILLTAVALPSINRRSDVSDGLVIGGGMAFLALCKMTFFVGFFPAVLLALIYKRKSKVLLVGLAVGLSILIVVTIWAGGISYWFEYINDLRFVQGVSLGERNGGWSGYFATPMGIFALLSILLGAVLLSKSDNQDLAILVLLFAPGFVFATYNNWGIEPKFLVFLALLIWVGARKKTVVVTGFAFLLIGSMAPTILNLTLSNLRPLAFNYDTYEPVFPNFEKGALMFKTERTHSLQTSTIYPDSPDEIVTIEGDTYVLSGCSIMQGNLGRDHKIMKWLTTLGLQSEGTLVADGFSNYWMFGDFKRIHGVAIWQYGGDYGVSDAGIVVVPDCPSNLERRQSILNGISDAGYGLSFIEQGEWASVFRLVKK